MDPREREGSLTRGEVTQMLLKIMQPRTQPGRSVIVPICTEAPYIMIPIMKLFLESINKEVMDQNKEKFCQLIRSLAWISIYYGFTFPENDVSITSTIKKETMYRAGFPRLEH